MKGISFILFIFIGITWISCDKIDQPVPLSEAPEFDSTLTYDTTRSDTNTAVRMILIEEFTGHLCTNCPEGAAEIQRLDSVYEDHILSVAIHSGEFAKTEANPDGSFGTDHTTAEGEEYGVTFDVFGYPSAMVSRRSMSGQYVLPKGVWESQITAILNDAPALRLDILNLFNDSVNIGQTNISAQWLTQPAGSAYKLQVYLVEDSIVDWQLNGGIEQEHYLHRHMLRKVLNGTWGTDLSVTATGSSEQFNFSFGVTSGWSAKHCSVIAFVYDAGTKEILQVAHAHVTHP